MLLAHVSKLQYCETRYPNIIAEFVIVPVHIQCFTNILDHAAKHTLVVRNSKGTDARATAFCVNVAKCGLSANKKNTLSS